MWTEQDEKQLKKLQRKKTAESYLQPMRNLIKNISTAVDKHTSTVGEIRLNVEYISPTYKRVDINIVLLGDSANEFLTLNDNTKNT